MSERHQTFQVHNIQTMTDDSADKLSVIMEYFKGISCA